MHQKILPNIEILNKWRRSKRRWPTDPGEWEAFKEDACKGERELGKWETFQVDEFEGEGEPGEGNEDEGESGAGGGE